MENLDEIYKINLKNLENTDNYFNKYMKYKTKYLKLKESFINYGGAYTENNFSENNFSENNFGNPNDGKYPPCYNICGATKKIYDILENKNLLEKYHELLDLYSIVLCQEVYLKKKKCNETMFNERYNLIVKSENIVDNIKKIVSDNIIDKPKNSKMIDFLNNITNNIEKNIKLIKLDKDLSDKERKEIIKMNNVFYQVHYNELTKNC